MSSTRVYVGKLPYDTRERDIEKFFKGYGRLREVLIKDGFAFIEFDDHRDADDAVYELNGKDFPGGSRVHVEFAREQRGRGRERFPRSARFEGRRGKSSAAPSYFEKYGPPRNTEYRVVVENLSSRISWQDLKDFMRQAGDVTYADAHKRERNTGIVDFATYSDMKTALEKLDGAELNGRRIRLAEDKNRRKRSRSRSRSRSRRSRSRSGSHTSKSRSRSRSRSKSHSRSRSKSPANGTAGKDRSKSRSRSRSPMEIKTERSRSRSVSKERSTSPAPKRSRSDSPADRRSGSRHRSKSPAASSGRRSRSRSVSRSRSRSRSRYDSRSRSRSNSPSNRRGRSRSASPRAMENGD